jgi:hypothetical protein
VDYILNVLDASSRCDQPAIFRPNDCCRNGGHQQYRCQELVQRTGSGTSQDSDDGKIGCDAGRECSLFLQCKRDVVGVRKRSSRGKGLYSENVHRHGRRNQALSRARQAVRGQKQGARSKEQGARMIFRTKLDGPITRNTAASLRGA